MDVCLELKPAAQSAAVEDDVNAEGLAINSADSSVSNAILVNSITADLKARRLTKPVGDNALEKIHKLIEIDPDHDYSINGVRYVARIYLSMARIDLKNKQLERASARFDAAAEVDPSLPGLHTVSEQIKANSQSRADESNQTFEATPDNNLSATPDNKLSATKSTFTVMKDAGPSSINGIDTTAVDSGRVIADEDSSSVGLSVGALITPVMVGLPAGTFVMGSEFGADNEKPAHQVQVSAFSMSRYEITREQFREFEADTGSALDLIEAGQALLPIAGVTAIDAVAYTHWLSEKTGKRYRLPTEAEWEYAARAGTMTPYHSGDTIFGQANCLTCLDDVLQMATPVGSFAPNAFGLYDMHGNVAEWTSSCLTSDYFVTSANETPHQVCVSHTVRGGSWSSTREQVRSSYRGGLSLVDGATDTGFRVVHDGL